MMRFAPLADLCRNMEATARSTFVSLDPDHGHWAAYAELWRASTARCPFQAPAILRWHGQTTSDATRLFALRDERGLRAAVVLRQNASGGLSFLSDLKTDVNRFLFHHEADEPTKRAFFDGLFRTVVAEGLALTLNSQPGDHPDTLLLLAGAKEAGLHTTVVENSACPVVEAATPGYLFDHVNGLRELRYRVNKLRNQQNAVFEVFTDEAQLDAWTEDFQNTHVRRWSGTATPSSFQDPARRAFVTGCLRAWAADGLLTRFSVRTAEGRIGFVIGLRAPDTLIHHSTTYDPAHAKSSPGKALIHVIAGWMHDNGLRILDFGDGREAYKFTVATGERPLHRIFIARRGDLRFIASSEMVRIVRGNRFLHGVYQRHVKRRHTA